MDPTAKDKAMLERGKPATETQLLREPDTRAEALVTARVAVVEVVMVDVAEDVVVIGGLAVVAEDEVVSIRVVAHQAGSLVPPPLPLVTSPHPPAVTHDSPH